VISVFTARVIPLRHDIIVEFNTNSKAEYGQLNLAHVTRKKYKRRNYNKRQCPLSSVKVQDR